MTGIEMSQSSVGNEFDSHSLGNLTVFNFPGKEVPSSTRADGVLRLPISMLSSKDDQLVESGRYKTNNQYGIMKGNKVPNLPGTAGNIGLGSLGSNLGQFERLNNSNEFGDPHGMRILSPNLQQITSPMTNVPSSFRGRGGSTHNGGIKIRGIQNRALNSIEYNSKFEDLGL